jgi:hypothetical protein
MRPDPSHYDRCIANGCSPRLAELLASRTFPGVRGTDREFLRGLHAAEEDDTVRDYRREAEALGVSTSGKKYLSTLAIRPGDPRAWVSGLDDVRAVLAERGWGCRGAIEVEPRLRDTPPEEAPAIAPGLIAEGVRDRLEEDPHADPEAVADELTRAWSRSPLPED